MTFSPINFDDGANIFSQGPSFGGGDDDDAWGVAVGPASPGSIPFGSDGMVGGPLDNGDWLLAIERKQAETRALATAEAERVAAAAAVVAQQEADVSAALFAQCAEKYVDDPNDAFLRALADDEPAQETLLTVEQEELFQRTFALGVFDNQLPQLPPQEEQQQVMVLHPKLAAALPQAEAEVSGADFTEEFEAQIAASIAQQQQRESFDDVFGDDEDEDETPVRRGKKRTIADDEDSDTSWDSGSDEDTDTDSSDSDSSDDDEYDADGDVPPPPPPPEDEDEAEAEDSGAAAAAAAAPRGRGRPRGKHALKKKTGVSAPTSSGETCGKCVDHGITGCSGHASSINGVKAPKCEHCTQNKFGCVKATTTRRSTCGWCMRLGKKCDYEKKNSSVGETGVNYNPKTSKKCSNCKDFKGEDRCCAPPDRRGEDSRGMYTQQYTEAAKATRRGEEEVIPRPNQRRRLLEE